METKELKLTTRKSGTSMNSSRKAAPSPKEAALAALDRTMQPLIKTWTQATRAHLTAQAELAEAAYNKALDAATAKYEQWCKVHHIQP